MSENFGESRHLSLVGECTPKGDFGIFTNLYGLALGDRNSNDVDDGGGSSKSGNLDFMQESVALRSFGSTDLVYHSSIDSSVECALSDGIVVERVPLILRGLLAVVNRFLNFWWSHRSCNPATSTFSVGVKTFGWFAIFCIFPLKIPRNPPFNNTPPDSFGNLYYYLLEIFSAF